MRDQRDSYCKYITLYEELYTLNNVETVMFDFKCQYGFLLTKMSQQCNLSRKPKMQKALGDALYTPRSRLASGILHFFCVAIFSSCCRKLSQSSPCDELAVFGSLVVDHLPCLAVLEIHSIEVFVPLLYPLVSLCSKERCHVLIM